MCIITILIMYQQVYISDALFVICFSQVPIEFQALYEKHKALFKKEVNGALSSFGLVVEQMQSNRMALLLKDVSAARNETAPEDPIDLTFNVPTDGGSGGVPTEPSSTPADSQMGEDMHATIDEDEAPKDDVAAGGSSTDDVAAATMVPFVAANVPAPRPRLLDCV